MNNMKTKVWHKVVIGTEEQEVEVYPTETYDGIIVETKELDGTGSPRLYLNLDEMELLVTKMREMMEYVKKQSGDGIGCVNGELTMMIQMLAYHITGSSPVLTTNMGILMEGGNKTCNMTRSGVTVCLMAPSDGLGSNPNISTKN